MLALLKELHAEGKLTPEQALFMADRRPEEELYDIQADPWEVENLAASAKHADVLKAMRGRLETWIKETGDKGQFPEKPEAKKPPKRKPKGEKGKRAKKADA
jgi:hypothetical protein